MLHVTYKDHDVGENHLDLLIGGELIVELKAVDAIAPVHRAQVLAYLKATGFKLALPINFNVKVLRNGVERIVLS